jgi:GTP:adenosylcobinamide-phosphate guanylyltransferase
LKLIAERKVAIVIMAGGKGERYNNDGLIKPI